MRRTCTSLAALVGTIVAGMLVLTGCSSSSGSEAAASPTLEADCDVEGISDAAHHLLEEGGLTMGDVQELRCADGWAVIRVGQSGDGAMTDSATFVFRQTEFDWVLKAPEIVCVDGPDAIPTDLATLGCPA